MPRGDGTGPLGMGPMTGRSFGFCTGTGMPGNTRTLPVSGFGWGTGGRGAGMGRRGSGGRGYRCMQFAYGPFPDWRQGEGAAAGSIMADTAGQKQALKLQAVALQARLDAINKRLATLEQEGEAE